MSIEYSVGICYGIIISDEELTKIDECFPNEEGIDDFSDRYLKQVDAWAGGDWFLGLYYDCGQTIISMDSLQCCWEKADLEPLEALIARYHLTDVIEWKPQKYIIQFCS